MRKSIWVIPALLLLAAIGAPNAHADTMYVYTYTLTAPGYDLTWTTNPMVAVTGNTTISAANLASSSVTGSAWTAYTLFNADLDISPEAGVNGVQATQFTQPPSAFESDIFNQNDGLTASDYSTPGTYTSSGQIEVQDYTCCGFFYVTGQDSLTVTAVSTPEPSSAILIPLGLGLVFLLRRKLIANTLPGLPKAA